MTALNFITDQNYIAVSTDTLSLSAESFEPYKFLDKAFLFQQMNCIIAGTGNVLAVLHWVSFVREKAYANGIDWLNRIAEESLPKVMEQEIITDEATTTIYQFGLSETQNCFRGYAYRSTNSLKSEEIQYGLGIKPTDAFDTDDKLELALAEFDDSSQEALESSFVNLMCKQKEYDDSLPKRQRVGIGGKIQLLLMGRDLTLSKCLYTFPDFEDDCIAISRNLK